MSCDVRMTFWLRLLAVSDTARQDSVSPSLLLNQLSGVEEGFADVFDPADDFNEYVALSLCRSIRQWMDANIDDNPSRSD